MKVLIIGAPRSGTTSLLNAIGISLKYEIIHEPFNYTHPSIKSKKYPFPIDDNTIVKTIYGQIPEQFTDSFDFLKEFSKSFDVVILLSRKNRNKLLESLSYQLKYNREGNWHNQYIYDDNINTEPHGDYVNYTCDGILKLNEELNIPIWWYEDLYSGDVDIINDFIEKHKLSLTVNDMLQHINPKKKYRLNIKKTLI